MYRYMFNIEIFHYWLDFQRGISYQLNIKLYNNQEMEVTTLLRIGSDYFDFMVDK